MSKQCAKRPHGQLRRSQVVTTFGPGAMLDLPKHSVLIAGLDYWSPDLEEIVEPRLVEKLKQLLGLPGLRLFAPPPDLEDPTAPPTGIAAWQFPEWFITQDAVADDASSTTRSRMLVHRNSLTKGKFIDRDKKRRSVVPVRFVRACSAGHIGDIDWYRFVHNEDKPCRRQLWIDERGTSGDLSEMWVRCECKAARPMNDAALMKTKALLNCDGSRPWLGPYTKEPCGIPNRLLIRNASNAYFPQLMRVISLPERNETVSRAVDAAWGFLEEVEDLEQLQYERRKAKVKAALEGVSDEEVMGELRSRRGGSEEIKPVKQAELETLVAAKEELGADRPDGVFFARTVPTTVWDKPWMVAIERVVLVHRLREVVASAGFTRFEATTTDVQGELEMGVRRAGLARETTWLPAIENKGEGIFLQFRSQAIDEWAARPDVQRRARELHAGFANWLTEHEGSHRQFPGIQHIMLHSLSHLLITAISLECGYPASSLRERIYALPSTGYGILIYTATSDAEGTLGGLVEVGHRIHEHLRTALEFGELCSNDPVCAQHEPQNQHEHRFLQGAACHGCLLIAETSCEQFNDFLDRALVVPTVDKLGIEFFPIE